MERLLSLRASRYVLIGLGVSACLFVGWKFYKDWQIIEDALRQARYSYLAAAFLCLQVSLALFAIGWHLLIRKLAHAQNPWQNLRLYCLANLGKSLPTPIWYIGGRAHLYGQVGYPRSPVIAGSLIELLLHGFSGLLMLGWARLLASGFGASDLLLCLLTLVALVWLLREPGSLSFLLQWWSRRKGNAAPVPTLDRRDLLLLMLIYSLTWINSIPFFLFIARGWLTVQTTSWISLWQIWLVSSLAGYAGTLLLGGVGFIREASLTVLLTPIMSFSLAVVVAASSRLVLMTGEILWGGACALLHRHAAGPIEIGTGR